MNVDPLSPAKVRITDREYWAKRKGQAYGIRLIVALENYIKSQQNHYYARKVKIGNLLIKNIGQYLANKDVYKEYLASKNKKDFRERHRTELTLYEEFSYVRAKYRELQTVANNVNQMLDLEHPIQKDLQQEQQL